MNKILFFVLFALQVTAQDTITFPKIDLYKRNIVEISYGIPLGELANKYGNSINTGIYFRTKIAKHQFIDFGAELSGIINGKNVEYEVNGEKVTLDGSKSSFLLGFRYTRFLYRSKNDDFHVESNSGIGWNYLHYSKPDEERFEELDFKPSLHTFVLSQGIKVVFYGFGLHCNYHYSPFNLFNSKVEREFGSSSINIGVSGSWNF
ncbi:hypothetical protein FIA58_012545 [Flavobacterium jejuense]|uniref:Outer membrane protein beta-barrel domain-containing protein n=1 Tax=Flavobacterium jejuense TaxID=1544455 RepID=A0ABX0IRU4_9FLAO|nr:hypothetical protein [Flavobacterium jejuense]NHN26507.1 hypothetical protein [Flavobacterium jejuense]